jgi:hypothetical protein
MTTRKEAKKAETEKFLAYVKSAIDEAHMAAAKAANEFVASIKLDKDGMVADICGSASVLVYKPSYRLREALKQLDEVQKWHGGGWNISHFWKDVPSVACQSITAHERACGAARKIFEARFPGEGEFFAPARVD